MNYTIPLPEALQLAARRRAERYASVQAELDEPTASADLLAELTSEMTATL